jgi:hypothetical protein
MKLLRQKLGESAAAFKGKLVRYAIEHDLLAREEEGTRHDPHSKASGAGENPVHNRPRASR